MGEPVTIPFEGINQDLKQSLIEIRDLFVQVRDAHKTAQANVQQEAAASVAQQEKLNGALTSTVAVIAQLDKQARSAGTGKIAEDLDRATASADKFGKTATTAAEGTADALLQVERNSKRATQANEQGARNLTTMRQRAQDLLGSIRSIPPEQRLMLSEIIKSSKSYEQLRDIAKQLAVEQSGVNVQVKTLRTQMLEARNEAALARQQFGEFSPEFQLATQRAGELQNAIQNIDKRIQALNPGQKFAAIGQLAQSIAGGFTAIQGVLGLVGTESEEVQRALLRVQSALAITQGLNAFFGGFQDSLKNIRALLGGATKAQIVNTAATRADIGVKVVSATATTGAATATAGLTASVRAFTAALLTNPIFLAIAALVALGAILLSTGDDAEDAKGKLDSLNESLLGLQDAIEGAEKRQLALRDAERELERIKSGDNLQKQAAIAKDAIDDEVRSLKLLASTRKDTADAQEAALDAAVRAGSLEADEIAKRREGIAALRQDVKNLENDAVVAARRGEGELLRLANERIARERQNAQERKRIREGLAKDLADIEKRIADLTAEQEIQAADPMQRVILERRAADASVALLEKTLQRRLALIELEKTMTAEAFKELSEIEKESRADVLIESGQIVLDPEQQEEIHNLLLGNEREFLDQLDKLFEDRANARIALIRDTGERENAQFEADLADRAEILRKAGTTEAEILEFQRRERAAFAQSQKIEAIDLEEQIGLAKIDAQIRIGETEKDFARRIELEKLALQEAFVQARIAAIIDDGSKETEALKATLNAQLAAIKNARTGIFEAIAAEPVDIFKLLGFSFSEEEKSRIQQGLSEIVGLVQTISSIAATEIEQQISATDQIIADRERRLDDLHSRLDQELRLNEQGFASNVSLIRDQIAEQEAAAIADKARRKSLLEEQKKIARQQLAIDQIVAASNLAVAATKVFNAEAIKGIPGIIAAIGFIATMFATFLSFKARAKAIANQDATLKKGGILQGPRHEKGGVPLFDRRNGKYMAEAEGGEYVVNRRSTVRYRDLIDAINDGDPAKLRREAATWTNGTETVTRELRIEHIVENSFAKAQQQAVDELLQSVGVKLDTEQTQLFIDQKKEVHQQTTINNNLSTKSLEKRVERTTDAINALREDMDSVEVRQEDRGRVERGRNHTNLVRR